MATSTDFKLGFGDATDGLGNSGQIIEFFHLISGKSVKFKAFITEFSDNFASDWNEETAYGRMDPIVTFSRTSRKISLAWSVPSVSDEESEENMSKCSLLLSMLYPSFERTNTGKSNIIKSPPLFKLKFMNLINNHGSGIGSAEAKTSGLLGYVRGFSYTPDLENGFTSTKNQPIGNLFPKLVSLSCEFTVLHQSELGWNEDGSPIEKFNLFPYSVEARKEEPIIESKEVAEQNQTLVSGETENVDSGLKEARRNQEADNVMFSGGRKWVGR